MIGYGELKHKEAFGNFEIGDEKLPLEFIKAFAIQKKASAISNIAIGNLEKNIGDKIIEACDKIINGDLDDEFPLSVWQTGSGTQTNMNLNEVIANYSNKQLGESVGEYKKFILMITAIWVNRLMTHFQQRCTYL